MGLRLTVRRRGWQEHVQKVAASMPGLIPVVKGNGYGFGRDVLIPIAAGLSAQIAVGTVYEAADVPADRTPIVLTPHLAPLPTALSADAVLTVGSVAHVHALRDHGWAGRVTVKLRSSMRRYGVAADELGAVMDAAHEAGMSVASYTIHLPLAGDAASHATEIVEWLPLLDRSIPVSVSHVDPATYATLRAEHGTQSFQIRSGTALWHGDKALLHLGADVLDVNGVHDGDVAGYHATPVTADGTLVLVAAGSSHGVRALDDGRSPFHFERQRVVLFEPPHMHTSMLFVPAGAPCPSPGDTVDVQRPLITSMVDDVVWVDD